ncbi:MAG: AAA family ATPase [Candidatus Accumulibacter similis]|nr:MAG: AAA family ATPase [Candidatus Accumulibacter similis]
MLDFNDAPTGPRVDLAGQRDDLRAELLARLPSVMMALFPAGKVRGKTFVIGDIDGTPGDSLEIVLTGEKTGLWTDRATGEGGDVFELIAQHDGLDTQTAFPAVMEAAAGLLGRALIDPAPARHEAPLDELGPHTARWDYLSATGELIACVYRYDPAPGRKEFRPWDVRARMCRAPDPRPLYNLPAVARADAVVLVEGEKCADALIRQGIVATTAMNGAKAPVDKTDWTPLAGKDIVIWPDRDAPGWDYAEAAARACVVGGSRSVAILVPPTDKPEKWDAADAADEGFDLAAFLAGGERRTIKTAAALLPTYTLGALLDDDSPAPLDLIAPRVLTPAGLLVFGGAPKVGKSDFLLAWLTHMAAGIPFLGMDPPRPLRVFYLQAEVQYHYLRERVKAIKLPVDRLPAARVNFVATPQLRLLLNEAGLAQVIPAIARAFGRETADIIAVDPIRNVFDGGEGSAGENDNAAMLFFLSQRVERLRDAVNPDAGIVLVHHTKKLGKRQFEDEPFQALSGASSLRGYYTTGMLLFRSDETQTPRHLLFELRNGPAIPTKHVDKVQGTWREVTAGERLVRREYGAKLDAERRRKRDVILQIIYDEAAKGRCYVATQFSMTFENQGGLGADRTIRERIAVLATKGYIKFFRNPASYGLPRCQGSRKGYLCVEDMRLRRITGEPDQETGELPEEEIPVLPTHYLCPQTGIYLPVENPQEWVYQEEEEV